MRVLDIILEAGTKPKLIRDGGQWKWQLPNGRKLGGFNSQRHAMDWAAANPEALGQAKPGTPEKRPRDERESGKRRADIVNKAGGEERVKTIKALKNSIKTGKAAAGRISSILQSLSKYGYYGITHYSGLRDNKLAAVRALAIAPRFYQIWGYKDMYNRFVNDRTDLEYYRDLPEDHPDYITLKFTQDEYDYAYRLLCQEYVMEIVLMESPVFIVWLLRIIVTAKWAARIGGGTLAAMTGGIGAGIGWGAMVVTETAVILLQKFFATQTGKEVAAKLVLSFWDPATDIIWHPWKEIWAVATGKSYDEVDSVFGPKKPESWDMRKDIKSMPLNVIHAELYDLKEYLSNLSSSSPAKPEEEVKIKRRIKELEDELARRKSGGSGGNTQVVPPDSTEVKPISTIPTKPARSSGALRDLETLPADR